MAARIVEAILLELHDRNGFGDWWFSIDKETRQQIKDDLIESVEAKIDG